MSSKNYQYYQPNKKDLKDKCGDCSIRAITKFFNISWVEAFDLLVSYARETQQMLNALPNIQLLMKDKNIPYKSIYKQRMKVQEFCEKNKNRKYILYIRVGYRTHLVCVDNGKYYDTWDCGSRIVYGYWEEVA